MIRFALAFLIALSTSTLALADWQVYREGGKVIASYDYASFALFRNQPSVWVRWHNVSKKAKYSGKKVQFTADCANHRLFEIDSVPYDHNGNFLKEHPRYDSPKEFPLQRGGLNQATYDLLCK